MVKQAELKELGLHRVHADGALFTYVKNGKLQGLITTHSDDLILAGNDIFEKEVISKLKEVFKFSKIEENSFKYCGCNIRSNKDGTIELDQNDYKANLEEIKIPAVVESEQLSIQEIKAVRGKIGELLWISLMTRPDISFDVNVLSSEVANGTIGSAKAVNCVVQKVKSSRNVF